MKKYTGVVHSEKMHGKIILMIDRCSMVEGWKNDSRSSYGTGFDWGIELRTSETDC